MGEAWEDIFEALDQVRRSFATKQVASDNAIRFLTEQRDELAMLLKTCDGTNMSMEWRDAVRDALAKLKEITSGAEAKP